MSYEYMGNITRDFEGLGIGREKESVEAYQSYQSYQSPPPATREYGEYGYPAPSQSAPPAVPTAPTYQPPPDRPPLPQGWAPLFDHGRQRWYYANQETGQTQWEVPGYVPSQPPMEAFPTSDSRDNSSPYPPVPPYGQAPGGYNAPPGPLPNSGSYSAPPGPPLDAGYSAPPGPPPNSGYNAPPGPPPGSGGYASYDADKPIKEKKKKSGTGGLLLGAAGGIAAGIAGTALLHHVLHDSDSSDSEEEKERRDDYRPAPQTVIINQVTEYNTEYNTVNTTNDYYGSDRESVRDEYEETVVRKRVSYSSSSSDDEEVEVVETREEYRYRYEEYEETYDD